VRTAYFTARAQKALVKVGEETLTNQQRHLAQIDGFVRAGTRPAIDLAQARTDLANARVQLITARNGYETAKATLNQAMGVERSTSYDVEETNLPPVDGEAEQVDQLVGEAQKGRPELVSLQQQVRAQELMLSSAKGGYGPALGASTALSDAGTDISNLAWNWNFTVTATWPLFAGLLTLSQVDEQRANVKGLEAQLEAERQQIRLEVTQALLAVVADKEALVAAEEALVNARERLRLAEGRYQSGVGSVIELGDAQVALTTAAAQRVQADYNLATARATLLKTLGRHG
jgi:outer membrane protein